MSSTFYDTCPFVMHVKVIEEFRMQKPLNAIWNFLL